MRDINRHIRDQNAGVNASDIKVKAVEKWLSLHANADEAAASHARPRRRAGQRLSPANAEEQELLGLLNHYCYRCHSSVRYNVFDKEGWPTHPGVRGGHNGYPTGSSRCMPQGRVLPARDKDRIIELSKQLFP